MFVPPKAQMYKLKHPPTSHHTKNFLPDEQMRNWPLAAAATWVLENILLEQADIQKSKEILVIIIMYKKLYKNNP